MENSALRRLARANSVPLWKIAAQIGISEPTITRWMRFPLPEDKRARIEQAISALSQEVE